jgi:hypothetical protein
MIKNNKGKTKTNWKELAGKGWILLHHWIYLVLLAAVGFYSFSIWSRYINNSDWSEETKQQYIKEKSVFSFENKNYQQALDLVDQKKNSLQSNQKFSGRDIFNPEGF